GRVETNGLGEVADGRVLIAARHMHHPTVVIRLRLWRQLYGGAVVGEGILIVAVLIVCATAFDQCRLVVWVAFERGRAGGDWVVILILLREQRFGVRLGLLLPARLRTASQRQQG